MDFFAMEYPAGGTGDFRESCLEVTNREGKTGCELFYKEHRIMKGKPAVLSDEIVIETKRPRDRDYMLSEEFLTYKRQIREIIN